MLGDIPTDSVIPFIVGVGLFLIGSGGGVALYKAISDNRRGRAEDERKEDEAKFGSLLGARVEADAERDLRIRMQDLLYSWRWFARRVMDVAMSAPYNVPREAFPKEPRNPDELRKQNERV